MRAITLNLALVFGMLFLGNTPVSASEEGPIRSFDGFYLGGHAGGTFGNADYNSDQAVGPGGPFVNGNINLDGFAGGLVIGNNFQVDNFVFGVEGDVTFGDVDGNSTIAGTNYDFDVDVTGTIRGRIGYAWDQLMLFGTAGIALADVKVSDNTGITGSQRETNVGFVVGGGLEFAFSDSLLFRTEYLYANYGNETYNLPGPAAPGFFDRADFETHTVRGAIIWRFGNLFGGM